MDTTPPSPRQRLSLPARARAELERPLSRRRALALLGGAGLAGLAAACSSGGGGSTSTTSAARSSAGGTTATTAAAASLTEIPDETGGPYPADGSNGPNVLTQDGVVRQDIRSSFGDSSGTADGVPLTVALTLIDLQHGATPYEGAAVYLWHCDREGNYSQYGNASGQNYLRGVQAAGADGTVTFTSVYPACYSGRWPHIHFAVFPDVDAATGGGTRLKTSQLALPEDTDQAVYATTGYSQSVNNLSRVSLDRDMVFSDGWTSELATMSGSASSGYTASLTVGV